MSSTDELATLRYPVTDDAQRVDWETLNPDWDGDGLDGTWMYWQPFRAFGDDGECTGVYSPGAWWETNDRRVVGLSEFAPSGVHPPTGPITMRWWPLTDGPVPQPEDVAARLQDLPVALVRVGQVTGLSLTGAGMDLGWHLAYAAILCGFLPWSGLRLHTGRWRSAVDLIGHGPAVVVRAALIERLERDGTWADALADVRAWGR